MDNGRFYIDFNNGWKFSRIDKDENDVTAAIFDDSKWENVTLPHTWNAKDCCGEDAERYSPQISYYCGRSAYRRNFFVDEIQLEKLLYIEFGAVNSYAEIYINGELAGSHFGGYSRFRWCISRFVHIGENQITVIVDNSPRAYIAPVNNEGDFTKQGGIYRTVRLICADKIHITLEDFGASGVYLTPENITGNNGDLDICVKVKNDSEAHADAEIHAVLLDKNGCEVGNASALANILPNEECSVNMKVGCDNITLWNGTKAPYLYTCKITVRSGKCIDTVTEKTGFRTFSLDSGNGIILNGRRVFLKGVNYHQDSFENGWAMNDKQRQRDYGMIADMGANAVRMAHYQHDKAEYDLCDDLGLAVWSEIPLINHTFTGDDKIPHPKLEENLLCQLTEMIRQNYNHPSVLFWGISNELYDTDNVTAEIYKKLVHKARAEDGTRVIIYADNVASVDTRSRSAAADAVGYNRYDGWYYSCLGGMSEWINEKYAVDNRPTCISEYGGAGAISQHMEQPEQTDIDPNGLRHFEEYLSILHEKTWENIFSMDNIFGAFIWCMFDFPSAGRIEGDTKGQNDKGLATRERVPKDVYYFYKSLWSGEPVVHITSKRFYRRTAVIPEVKIYSNAASVRVFVNGEFIGDAERKGNVFILKNVRLKTEQDNHIRAEAVFYDGIILSDECLWIGQ